MDVNSTPQSNGSCVRIKSEKEKPPNLVIPPKKPKLTKAERRALQEQQRAAKTDEQGGQQKVISSGKSQGKEQQISASSGIPKISNDIQGQKPKTRTRDTETIGDAKEKDSKEISVLSHLPSFRGKYIFNFLVTSLTKWNMLFASHITVYGKTKIHKIIPINY
mmetsp:Transcript_6551/g.7135  ORF Transcript_6551/g.7135 Transcript_6551/m.7135 type:complete len:163 (+) Transcript_6551:126-614(+)